MNWSIERKITASVGVAVAVLLVNAFVSYRATRSVIDRERLLIHTHEVRAGLEAILSTMKDAETGERGYIITGEDAYLQPYDDAIDRIHNQVESLRQLTADNPDQQARLPALERKIE